MHLTKEERYIRRRLRLARKQARQFYYCRKYPINPKKIVFTTIEGTTGFSCNPKYIALELLRRRQDLDLVWLVDDMAKEFPPGIRKVRNTLQNRAYELATAAVWVDNSRKQLECRKRPGQFYLQTWHGSIWLKPLGMERGVHFSKIAYYVSAHDSQMVDVWLSNSLWLEEHAEKGLVYKGRFIRVGSPRCDVIVKEREKWHSKVRELYGIPTESRVLMYAPTFRSGSQGTNRVVQCDRQDLDFAELRKSLEKRFGGNWYILLRLHPQLTARKIKYGTMSGCVVDVSDYDDMYELLAGCDAVLTDYSSIVFDGIAMGVPTFLYVSDYEDYVRERGGLVWDIDKLPVKVSRTELELRKCVETYDVREIVDLIERFKEDIQFYEDGYASRKSADYIMKVLEDV